MDGRYSGPLSFRALVPQTVGVGTGVPFGYIVTADGGISTGVSSSSGSSSPASLRSAWLTLHAVNRRFIHSIFFSRSSERERFLAIRNNSNTHTSFGAFTRAFVPLPVPWSCRCFAPMSVWQSMSASIGDHAVRRIFLRRCCGEIKSERVLKENSIVLRRRGHDSYPHTHVCALVLRRAVRLGGGAAAVLGLAEGGEVGGHCPESRPQPARVPRSVQVCRRRGKGAAGGSVNLLRCLDARACATRCGSDCPIICGSRASACARCCA